MEFKDVMHFIIRHYRLLVLGLLVGGGLGLIVAFSSPAPYEATSKILISRTKSDKDSDFGYLTDQQLIQTYAYILKTRPVLDLVKDQVNGEIDPDNVHVSQIVDTLILQIAVRDPNPQRAAYIANAFAQAMVIHSEQLQEKQYELEEEGLTSQINSIRTQLDELEAQYDKRETTVNQSIIDDVDKQILAYRNEILTLQKEITLIKTPTNLEQESYIIERSSRLEEIQPLLTMYQEIRTNLEYLGRPYQSGSTPEDTTLSRLKTTILQYQELNLTLLNSLEKIRLEKVQSGPTVQTIEEAVSPTDRTSLSFILNPVISSGAGLILAILLGLLLERRGVRMMTQQQMIKNLGLEIIGAVSPLPIKQDGIGVYLKTKIDDPVMRSFDNLRAFLEFQRIRNPYRNLLVTSFTPGDGKSTIASAIAVNYALGGDNIVLVDANFVNAEQHIRFKTEIKPGLTEILFKNQAFKKEYLKATGIANLKLLTIGAYTPISMQLVDPEKMTGLLRNVSSDQKLVIVDGSLLSDLNARLLASAVDKILLVLRVGVYSAQGLDGALNDLGVDRQKILGVVLNEPLVVEDENRNEVESAAVRVIGLDEASPTNLGLVGTSSIPRTQKEASEERQAESIADLSFQEKEEVDALQVPRQGADEPETLEQGDFVQDSTQERVLSRLFRFPSLLVKKQAKGITPLAGDTGDSLELLTDSRNDTADQKVEIDDPPLVDPVVNRPQVDQKSEEVDPLDVMADPPDSDTMPGVDIWSKLSNMWQKFRSTILVKVNDENLEFAQPPEDELLEDEEPAVVFAESDPVSDPLKIPGTRKKSKSISHLETAADKTIVEVIPAVSTARRISKKAQPAKNIAEAKMDVVTQNAVKTRKPKKDQQTVPIVNAKKSKEEVPMKSSRSEPKAARQERAKKSTLKDATISTNPKPPGRAKKAVQKGEEVLESVKETTKTTRARSQTRSKSVNKMKTREPKEQSKAAGDVAGRLVLEKMKHR